MVIHTIGDSHSYAGWTSVINHHISSLLCYSFGKEKLNRIDIRNFNIKDGDTVIFCLGEIDCRCHVHKHITETVSYNQIIDNIVENYFDAIKLNVITSGLTLKHICVYNVVPPIQKSKTNETPDWPFLGTDEDRKKYCLYFNKQLKEKCIENNFIFFDIYDNYIDENGFLLKYLSDGSTHIKDGIYLTKFINENNLK